MKIGIQTLATKASLILAVVLILTSVTVGQSRKSGKPVIPQKMIDNLILNIKSDNDGLRESAIHLTGKYQIEQTVDALIEQLSAEENPDIRISIALALYKIGGDKGLDALYTKAASENDPYVKSIYYAIVKEYSADKNILATSAY